MPDLSNNESCVLTQTEKDFLCLNICGINSKIKYRNFQEHIESYSFVCLSEIRTSYIAPDEFPGFHSIISDRKCTINERETRKSTGIAILLKENISYDIIKGTNCEWVLWIKVSNFKNKYNFLLGSVYIPGETSVYHNSSVYDILLCDMLDLYSKYDLPFVLMGDFNSRTGNRSDLLPIEKQVTVSTGYTDEHTNYIEQLELTIRSNSDNILNKNGQGLLSLCQTLNLRILNGRFGSDKGVGGFTCHTQKGESTVDYIIISDSLIPIVDDFSIEPLDNTLSDVHSALNMSFHSGSGILDQTSPEHINSQLGESTETCPTQTSESYSLRWKDNIGTTFKGSFSENSVNQLLVKLNSYNENNTTQEKMDELTNDLVNIYIQTAQAVGLCKKRKDQNYRTKKPYSRRYSQKDWFDDECEKKRKEYMKFKNKGRYIRGKKEKKMHSKLLSNKHKEYQKFLRKKENKFRINIEKQLRDSKNSIWNILGNHTKPVNENNIPLNTFKEHFQKLNQVYREIQVDFNPSQILEPDQVNLEDSDLQELNKDFTISDIEKIIKKLKNGKSPGGDHIIGEYLKNSPETLIETITNLFNLVLKSGVVPSNWCTGVIIPLFKNKGSVNSVDNYRGITLLSVIGKLFTSAINERLAKFLDNISARGEEQIGFRPGYSTLYHIFVLHTLIGFYLNNKKRLYCCFIDYSKAFDLIDRVTLWRKLIDTGITGNVLRVIYNLYIKAKSCVKKGKNISEFF